MRLRRDSNPFFIIIGILSIIVVLFLPFGIHIDLGPGPNSLISMIWEISLEPAWYTIRYFSAIQFYVIFCVARLFFLLEIFLMFLGKYNRMRLLIIGLISEGIPLLLSIPAMFILNAQGDNLYPIILPIPILLLFDLALIRIMNRKNS